MYSYQSVCKPLVKNIVAALHGKSVLLEKNHSGKKPLPVLRNEKNFLNMIDLFYVFNIIYILRIHSGNKTFV